MPKDSDKPKSEQQEPEPERKFNREQYEMLKRCSDKKDMTEWSKWREEHRYEKVQLEDAPLEKLWLLEANLQGAKLWLANLQDANLFEANLQDADLLEANLQDASLLGANLQDADLQEANLQDADLLGANLQGAYLWLANLQDACLESANLQGANLEAAKLQDAKLGGANLQGAYLVAAKLQGADFSRAIVDGGTLIWDCQVDRKTNFEGVGLGSARIETETKQLLEYNIRRMNWEEWYKGESEKKWIIVIRPVVTFPIRLFWAMNDYGRSTLRIISTFFGFAIAFAFVYWLCPSLVVVDDWFIELRGFVHALYFSVVTMTTLGFGDIAANPDNWVGQVLLMVQVILGYVLLGALVTRFAVLFTAGGPAGTFSKREPIETGKREQGEKQKDQHSK